MTENIEEIEFTIFDTETTGLDPACGDRIVELAALRVKGEKKLAEFGALVNPGRAVSPEAFAVNKITPEMLAAAPGIEKIMPQFLEFIKGSYLCSYNARFDLGFLNNELRLLGRPAVEDLIVFDVLTMARRLLPGLERYPLWFVAQKLEVKQMQMHRAMADVRYSLEKARHYKRKLYVA